MRRTRGAVRRPVCPASEDKTRFIRFAKPCTIRAKGRKWSHLVGGKRSVARGWGKRERKLLRCGQEPNGHKKGTNRQVGVNEQEDRSKTRRTSRPKTRFIRLIGESGCKPALHQIGLEKRPHLSGPSTWPSGLKTAHVQPGHTVRSQTRKLPEIQRRMRRIADKCNQTRPGGQEHLKD